ncbi:beta-ketoacyl-[acyl-carrier-protein] synthase family protein [Odoribacter sp. OttesenSCG-928-L07]|nr:beta-ketoacyl-[acyl-carrier-protein] synthase family protein [Odoribacter sp. OttesenSCG-928-L07]MDL2238894.1 beta-ketoacyl-[acyl-carrier-protein] synthase family protein [Bacteroidales bacterium OttesenSCG-928-L14]MDL2240634.1 beta-ketoacyl-[acyl-carrier-protein] synthase family protein [Bacteroidales bacterium OttesenSCG-928-K22]
MRNIFVTGMGIITSLGIGKDRTLQALQQKKSSIGAMKYLQTTHNNFPVGEVQLSTDEMGDFLNVPDGTYTRTALLGRIALKEALQESEINEKRPKRLALISGTTVGGMDKSEIFYNDFLSGDKHTEYIETHDCGATTDLISKEYQGKFDVITTISTACSSAANAVILGANLIKTGRVDAAIVGGSECLSKFHLNGFKTLMILDSEHNKPFDRNRNGLNLGEGAAFIVIESEESVNERNVNPICKLSGYANTCDAFHQTATSPNGEGAFLAMEKAIQESGLKKSDIDYINAHGTGTDNNDLTEGIAIMRVFGDKIPPVSSIKSFTGHTTSAAGSVESVISILALKHNFIPVNLNFTEQIEELSFKPATEMIPNKDLKHVITNSFGFGGNDSSCIFSQIDLS